MRRGSKEPGSLSLDMTWHTVFFHLDLNMLRGPVKFRIFVQDLSQALTFAISDLKANWRLYKQRSRGGR